MSTRSFAVLLLVLAFSSVGCLPLRQGDKDIVHKPTTYVAMGDFRLKSAFSVEFNEDKQREYRLDARNCYEKALELDAKCVEAHVGLARLAWTAHALHDIEVEEAGRVQALQAQTADVEKQIALAKTDEPACPRA